MADEPLEKTIVMHVLAYINAIDGAYAHKVHGGAYGNNGEPDVDAVINGRAVKLECKRPKGSRLTKLQQRALDRWAAAGAVTGVVTCVGDVEALFLDAGIIRPVP